MKPATNLEITWVTEFDYYFGCFLPVHVLLLVVFHQVNTGRCRIQYYQLLQYYSIFNIINININLIFHLISFKVFEVLLSCFHILIELVVDTESVLSSTDCEIFLFLTS